MWRTKAANFYSQMFMRGRAPFAGDRYPPSMPLYLYEGYFGINVGDEIIHQTSTSMLDPACAFKVGRYQTPRFAIERLLRIRRFRGAVVGGGTILPRTLIPYLNIGSASPMRSYIMGTGTVGYKTTSSIDLILNAWREFLQKTSPRLIAVRGPRSARFFEQLGIEASICGDTALSFFSPVRRINSDPVILLNFGSHGRVLTEPYLRQCQAIVEHCLKYGHPITLVPLHYHDMAVHAELMRRSSKNRAITEAVSMILHIPTPDSLRMLVSQAIFGVGERLHFGISLLASGTPALMLGYSEKHLDFAESIGAESYIVPLEGEFSELVVDKLQQLETEQFCIDTAISMKLDEHRRCQSKMFIKVRDELLQNDTIESQEIR